MWKEVEILLLRNYYSSLTYECVGDSNVTEDVTPELSPRYSRKYDGDYALTGYRGNIFSSSTIYSFGFGNLMNTQGVCCIGFGDNTAEVTFNDYVPTGKYQPITSTKKSNETTYDSNTKTYTTIVKFTLTNPSSNILNINEIMLGSASTYVYYTRDLLGENSFVLNANESVDFELTIKYTIAEPLQ